MSRRLAGLPPVVPELAVEPTYSLRLYVTGTTPTSLRAIHNLREICEESLHERYDLEVVDIYQQPGRAREDQIIAAPTLVKSAPLPRKLIIGDLSDRERVLRALNLPAPQRTRPA
jgi:circadian clock protein KaiB